jgi:hypothetical protein
MDITGVTADAHLPHLQIPLQVVVNIFVLIFFHLEFSYFQVDLMFGRYSHFVFITEELFIRLALRDLPGRPNSFFLWS